MGRRRSVIDWLRRAATDPVVEVAGRALPVVLRRHPTARRMTMRLAPDGTEVRITLPRWGRTAEALEFARSRAEWLEAQLRQFPERETVSQGSTINLRGDPLPIRWAADAPRRPALIGRELVLGGPLDALPNRVQRWLEGIALELMQSDLAHYCAAASVAVPRLRLSRAQRRWGSCSADGMVRINWRLVQAPDAIRRSVIAHEVAHLVHFDHSPAFHDLLRSIFEHDVCAANEWLKREGRSLYRQFG